MALLAAALLLGQDVRAVPDVQRADALRSLELVRRDRQQVDAERLDVEVDPRRGLHRVDVEQDTAPCANPGDELGDRLDRPDLVVGEHERDEDRPIGDARASSWSGIDPAIAVDRQLDDLEAELLEVAQGVTDGVMLDRGGDDPVAARLARPGRALEGKVVGLGAARCEHDLAGLGVEARRDTVVGVIERGASRPTERVRRTRVAEGLGQEREHGIEDLAADRRGRRVIEVDRHAADRTPVPTQEPESSRSAPADSEASLDESENIDA